MAKIGSYFVENGEKQKMHIELLTFCMPLMYTSANKGFYFFVQNDNVYIFS